MPGHACPGAGMPELSSVLATLWLWASELLCALASICKVRIMISYLNNVDYHLLCAPKTWSGPLRQTTRG